MVAVDESGVWVETIRRSTCGACSASSGCGHGLLQRFASGSPGLVRALPGAALAAVDCRIGDQVVIELPEDVVLRGSLIVYAVPLLALLAGAALPAAAGVGGDAPALAGAAAGLLAGLALVRWHGWRYRHDPRLQPVLVSITARAGQPLTLR